MYKRNCPQCNNEIFYKNQRKFKDADKKSTLCRSCSKKGEKNPYYGITGELHPKYGIGLSGDLNPSKRPEVRLKISQSKKGKPSPMLGRKHTEETKEKQRISNTGKNHKISDEGLLKMKEARAKQIGEKNPFWKGGRTKSVALLRNSKKYSDWRTAVFFKNNYTCLKCKKMGGKLEAHHITSVSESMDSIFDISNGATLCKSCHNIFHKQYGNRPTKDNFYNFII